MGEYVQAEPGADDGIEQMIVPEGNQELGRDWRRRKSLQPSHADDGAQANPSPAF
jgi:hypothetical protein